MLRVQGPTAIIFDNNRTLNQNSKVGASTDNVADSSYTFILHDQSVASMDVTQAAGSNASSQQFFLGADEAPNSHTEVAQEVRISVLKVNVPSVTQLTIVGNDTGATASITITNNLTEVLG